MCKQLQTQMWQQQAPRGRGGGGGGVGGGRMPQPCRDWAQGYCARGASCKFYHDPQIPQRPREGGGGGAGYFGGSMVAQPPYTIQQVPFMGGGAGANTGGIPSGQQPCRDWAKGYCARGTSCRFFHNPQIPQMQQQQQLQQSGNMYNGIPAYMPTAPPAYGAFPPSQSFQSQGGIQPFGTVSGSTVTNKPCRDWVNGYCPRGASCKFYHDPSIPQHGGGGGIGGGSNLPFMPHQGVVTYPSQQQQQHHQHHHHNSGGSGATNNLNRDRTIALQYLSSIGQPGQPSTVMGDLSPREIAFEVMRSGPQQTMTFVEARRQQLAAQLGVQPQMMGNVAVPSSIPPFATPMMPHQMSGHNNNYAMEMGGWTNQQQEMQIGASEQFMNAFQNPPPPTSSWSDPATTTRVPHGSGADLKGSEFKAALGIPPTATEPNTEIEFHISPRTQMTKEEEMLAFANDKFELGKIPENILILS